MKRFDFSDQERARLAQVGVKMLVVFGSQAQGVTRDTSDVDALVFGPDNKPVYDAIYELMSKKIDRLTDIDIVFAGRAPMELLNHASKYGRVIYARRPSDFADFRQRVMLMYSDFAPYRNIFQRATLERI